MSNHFDAPSDDDETGAIGIDLTVSEFATSVASALLGTAAVAVITVLMLL